MGWVAHSMRYVAKVAEDCNKNYKSIVKIVTQLGKDILVARDGEDHAEELLQKWTANADSAGEMVKALRAKVQNMRQFAMKAAD